MTNTTKRNAFFYLLAAVLTAFALLAAAIASLENQARAYDGPTSPDHDAPHVTYYVDASVPTNGDGLTPETAFKGIEYVYLAVRLDSRENAVFDIYLAPGVYENDGLWFDKSINFHGAGMGLTIVDASQPRSNPETTGTYYSSSFMFLSGQKNYLVEDMSFVGRPFIDPNSDPSIRQPFSPIFVYSTNHTTTTLRRVEIKNSGVGVKAIGNSGFSWSFGKSGPVIIQNSIFNNNGGAIHVQYDGGGAPYGGGMPHATVENSIIANSSEYGFFNTSPLHTFRNNIFINNAKALRYALHPGEHREMILSHNLFWNNGIDYVNPTGVITSVGELHVNPLLSEDGYFFPDENSPIFGKGNPASTYNDRDGSRNDLGSYGGPHAPGVDMALTPATSNIASGDTVSMTLYMENIGEPAGNVGITITLPGQITPTAISPTGVISGSNVYLALGDVADSATAAFAVAPEAEQPSAFPFQFEAVYEKAGRVQRQDGTTVIIVDGFSQYLPVVFAPRN